jgi:hypothetical protein
MDDFVLVVGSGKAYTKADLLESARARDRKPFDRKLWFSDTYVRTKTGWRYAFGQASLSLPAEP